MSKRIKRLATPNLDQPLTADLLGQVIRARRTQSNLTLADTAGLCGLAKDTLTKIERGQPTCHLGSVLQICHGLGIKLYVKAWIDEDSDAF